MRKKAQSQIITTILLILIVLTAVIVIWIVVSNFFKPLETDGASCMGVNLKISKANSTDDTILVMRMAGGEDGDVTGVVFLVNGQRANIDEDESGPCTADTCDSSLVQLETKKLGIQEDFSSGDDIEVAPLVGQSKQVCSVIDSIKAI